MNKQWAITVAAVALTIVFGQCGRWQYRRAVAFEARAVAAESKVKANQITIDVLTQQAAQHLGRAAKKATVVVAAKATVAAVDSASPPDTSCAPNLAARDSVIEAQDSEITDLHGAVASQAGAINLLQASKDELAKVLASRPSYYPRFVGPNIGIGVFGGICGIRPDGKPEPCVGVGVTVNLFSMRF